MQSKAHAIARIFFNQYDAAFSHAQAIVGPNTHIMCVVKANAYGLGVATMARRALQNGARFLAVAYLSEALELRNQSITAPILVFTQPEPEEFDEFIHHQLTASLYSDTGARQLIQACQRANRTLDAHIYVDTGMSRLGCLPNDVPALLDVLLTSPCIHLTGIYSHFAASDNPDSDQSKIQLERFNQVLEYAQSRHSFDWIHMANSAALITMADSRFNMVRMGLLAYQDCVQLSSHISTIRRINAGESVSYNATYICKKDTLIATVPIGYADGIPVSASNRIVVDINGKQYPQVGRVTMDSLMLDLGDDQSVSIGDPVLFFGPGSSISLNEFASQCHTIAYEILCRIGSRVLREYI